ncbi:MAG: response regulator [Chloroflexota bacterium]
MTLLRGKRVFYIEDDGNNRAIVQTILEAAGATLQFDNCGFMEISLRKIKAFHPDVILLDLMLMSRISGYDVYTTLRLQTQFITIPIVAVSASDPEIEIPKTREIGFAGFIGKPIDVRLFASQIDTILRGESVWHIA